MVKKSRESITQFYTVILQKLHSSDRSAGAVGGTENAGRGEAGKRRHSGGSELSYASQKRHDPELVPTKRSMAQIHPERFELFYQVLV
jgi:hypothetical protein